MIPFAAITARQSEAPWALSGPSHLSASAAP